MKKVFSADELSHVWASQRQSEGRTPTRNMFFKGSAIWSYGYHFCLADFHPTNKEVVFLNNNTYSNTTSKQQALVRYAVNHKTRFAVNKPHGNEKYNDVFWGNIIAFYQDHKRELQKSLAPRIRKITAVTHKQNALYELNNIARFLAFFDLTIDSLKNKGKYVPKGLETSLFKAIKKAVSERDALITDADKIVAEDYRNGAAERREKREESKRIAAARRVEKSMALLPEWLSGTNPYEFNGYILPEVYLRVIDRSEEIEVQTTRGARVPLNAAKLLYEAVKSGRDVKGWEINGYTVTANAEGYIKIGCHTITKNEVERFAKSVGW